MAALLVAAAGDAGANEPVEMGEDDSSVCEGTPLDTPDSAGLLEASLDQLRIDHALAGITQEGDVTNCGPTAAAMLLASYVDAVTVEERAALQAAIGRWSWEEFPLRRVALPGYDAGMTTVAMLRVALEAFTDAVRFTPPAHPWIPAEAWSIIALKRNVVAGRPLLALVQSSTLWDVRTPGLHWIVVRGLEDGVVIYNDPADGTRSRVPFERFWQAWRLNELYRRLPLVAAFQGLAPDRPLPQRSLAMDAPAIGPAVAR